MSIDEYINQMSWKKITLVIVSAFIVISLFRFVMFMSNFKKITYSVDQRITQQEKFLNNVHEQFKKANKKTDELTNETFNEVHLIQNRINNNIHNMQKNMQEKTDE